MAWLRLTKQSLSFTASHSRTSATWSRWIAMRVDGVVVAGVFSSAPIAALAVDVDRHLASDGGVSVLARGLQMPGARAIP